MNRDRNRSRRVIDCGTITVIDDRVRTPSPPAAAPVLRTGIGGGSRPPLAPPPRARRRPPVFRTHAVFVLRRRASQCCPREGRPPPRHDRSQFPSAVHARSLCAGLTDDRCAELSAHTVCVRAGGLNEKGSGLRTLACVLLRSQSLARSGRVAHKGRNFSERHGRTATHLPEGCSHRTRLATQPTQSVTRSDPCGPPTSQHAFTTSVRPGTRGGAAPPLVPGTALRAGHSGFRRRPPPRTVRRF